MAARLSYSSLADLKNKCSTNSELADFAENCCSDKVGICDQFTPQYCATKSNYQPTAIWNTGCLKFFSFSTQIEYNNEVCHGTKEVAGEGSGICFLPNIPKTSSCPSGESGTSTNVRVSPFLPCLCLLPLFCKKKCRLRQLRCTMLRSRELLWLFVLGGTRG